MKLPKLFVALFSIVAVLPPLLPAPVMDQLPFGMPQIPRSQMHDFKEQAAQIVAKVPDGTTLEAQNFDTVFGADTANTFRSAGITKVSNQASHYRVEFQNDYELDVKSIHVRLKQLVEFDYVQSADSLVFTNIKGVEVNKSSFLRHSDLKEFTLGNEPNGNIVVNAKVKVFGLWGKDVHIAVAPDGKTVVK
jgi:hypothetical protein